MRLTVLKSALKKVLNFPFRILPPALRPSVWWKTVRAPMPLEDVSDYNRYWDKRPKESFAGPLRRAVLLDEEITAGTTLCDVGCGKGEFLKYFCDKGVHVEGVEVSDAAIEVCRQDGLSVHKANLFDSDTPVPGDYDYITAMCLLEHLQDPEVLMRKVKGHFKKNFIVAVPNVGYLPHRIRLLCGRFPVVNIFHHVREHIRFWTVSDFMFWAGNLGYQVEKIIPFTKGRLSRWHPSLFSSNIIYLLKEKDLPLDRMPEERESVGVS